MPTITLKQQCGRWVYAHLPVSRRTFNTLRMEVRFFRQRLLNAVLPWRRAKIRRLYRLRGVSLNVGSGGRGRPDWINFDASPYHADLYSTYDIRRPLPFANGAVRRIFAEHVVEHLDYYDDIPRVMAEFHRVLEPGGVLRIIVPDVRRYVAAYLDGGSELWRTLGLDRDNLPGAMLTPMEMVNHVFHQDGEHYFGWDFTTLDAVLRRAGFSRVLAASHGTCIDPELALDQANHAPYSLYVDAVR